MDRPLTLDRANGKIMGVCAGIAAATGADVTLVRLAAVAAFLFLSPVALVVYLVAAWITPEAG